MEYTTLGRTGLRVSVMGLGCGGPSRIGRSTGSSEAEQVAIIRGMVQQNYSLDQTTYNSLGLLLAGRLRLWTEASKVPATGGGSETDGLIATYNITTTPKPTNQDMVDYYKVVKA